MKSILAILAKFYDGKRGMDKQRQKFPIIISFFLICLVFTLSCSSGSASPTTNIPTHDLTIDLPGKSAVTLIDNLGRLTQGIQATSADGSISLAIDKGATLLDKDGKYLEVIKVSIESNTVNLPADTEIAGLMVDIQPQQATAGPSIKLTLNYDPTILSDGGLWIYNYSGDAWELVRYKQVDAKTNRITTTITRFGKYGVLASKVPIETPLLKEQQSLMALTLQQALSNGKPTLAEFGSVTCIPCKEMKPILEKLSVDYQDRLNVVFVEIYEQRALADIFKIMAMPTQVVFDAGGNEISRHIGLWPRDQIDKELNKLGVK